ncbi:L-cystine transporter [Bacillaceae bacterium SIJ1]|uniref:L-cystine transporter n=1 Tax=Litoribacterium kuwaitense TaxID=1398745 RepID=UPI0013EA3676|nr:L-cystine transporter [Litoribacterium kuwaitense]NGP45925.1 L-cystine transporter [Litoribacterium kuwaitense]
MEVLLTVAVVLSVLALLAVLFYMAKKHVSFSKRVFVALGAGIAFGLILQAFASPEAGFIQASMEWVNIVGRGYVRFLQMIVMPLVFISILVAFTRLTFTKNLGKISGLIIGVLIGTTAIAAIIGITSAVGFDLDAEQIVQTEAEESRGAALEERSASLEAPTLPQQILQLLPANPFLDLTGDRATSVIGVVIFAAFLGVAYLGVARKQPEQGEFFKKMVDAVYAIIMRVVTLILRLTPYGVLALMVNTVATSDLGAIYTLGKFVIASYVALLVMFIIHLIILTIIGLNPLTYIKKTFPTLTFAFTSRSSAGTLPLNIQTQKNLGVPDGIANFAGSFGLSIGQNGCAGVYPAMLAVMIAPSVGINPLDPMFLLSVIAIVAISSFGVAGVGGGATFAAILVLSALDLPVALAGVLISVEPLIDMGRTAVNVSGSMVSGLFTSRVTKAMDHDAYIDENKRLDTSEFSS